MIGLLALLWLGCATPEAAQPVATAPTETPSEAETPVQLNVKDTAGFATAMQRYAELAYGDKEPATLEVILAPGTYKGVHLTLGDKVGKPPVNVILRGSGSDTVLDGVNLDVSGPEVTVSGLRFTGKRRGIALQASAQQSIHLSDLVFVDQQLSASTGGGSRRRQGLVLLEAAGPEVKTTVERTWWVGNQLNGNAAITLQTQNGRFADPTLDGIVAVNNQGGPLVGAQLNTAITVRDGALLLAEATPVLQSAGPKGPLQLEDSTVLADAEDKLVSAVTGTQLLDLEFLPAQVRNSTLFVRGEETDTIPGSLLDATEVQPAVDMPNAAENAAAAAVSGKQASRDVWAEL